MNKRRLALPMAAVVVVLTAASATPARAAGTGPTGGARSDRAAAAARTVLSRAVATVSPAFSTACGRLCDNQDPLTFAPYPHSNVHCADDVTTVRQTEHVLLRYSPRCETTWALRNTVYWDLEVIYSDYSNGTRRAAINAYAADTDRSPMLDDHALLNFACIRWYNNEWDTASGNNPHWECTGKY